MGSDILVLGRSGQVARALAQLGHPCFGRESADFETECAAHDLILDHRPRAVINAAAYTDVDGAEHDEARATRINGAAVGEVAVACARLGIPLVHLSTDYVFEGQGMRPWRPDDPTNPRNAYGRSKRVGEVAVQRAAGPHAILRTAWVFSAEGTNFVKTMLRLGAVRDQLAVVDDQWGGPTPARDIARAAQQIAVALVATPEKTGVYHFTGAPMTSWHGFATEIMVRAGLKVGVDPIPTEAFPTPAARPANSRLDGTTLYDAFGISPADWHEGLDNVLGELGYAA